MCQTDRDFCEEYDQNKADYCMFGPVTDGSNLCTFLQIPDKFFSFVLVLVSLKNFPWVIVPTGFKDKKSLQTSNIGIRDLTKYLLEMTPCNNSAFRSNILTEIFPPFDFPGKTFPYFEFFCKCLFFSDQLLVFQSFREEYILNFVSSIRDFYAGIRPFVKDK